jgi:hypothetical protein
LLTVFPQPSVAVTVKVCDLEQPPVISPATAVIVGVPQPSVADEAAITLVVVGNVGLHPKANPVVGTFNVGAVESSVQVYVTVFVAVLPQASVAITVNVCDLPHVPVIEPAVAVIVGVPQPSVADEAAITLSIVGNVGLHPKANPVVGTVNSGAVVSSVQV